MKEKIIGIFIVMLLIATALPVMGTIEKSSYMTEKNEPFVFLDPKTGEDEEMQYIMMETDIESTPSKGTVRTQDNLAPNPSFEEGDVLPTGWEHTDFGQGEAYHWDSDYAHTGEKSVGISVPTQQNWYKWYTTDLIPVDNKNNYYEFSCYYKYTAVPDIAWQQVLEVGIELYDENEEMITGILGIAQYHDTLDWCFAAAYTESIPVDIDDAVYARLKLCHWPNVDSSFDIQIRMDDVFFGIIEENNPPEKPTINGPTSGKSGEEYTYTAVSTDPDGDMIRYKWDWGDGNISYTHHMNSGTTYSASHTWENKGTYEVKVQVADIKWVDSEWSDPLVVSMPKNKAINTPFLQFLAQHPHLFPLLRQLLML